MKNSKTAAKMTLVFMAFLAVLAVLTALFYRWWDIPRPLEMDVESASVWTVQAMDPGLEQNDIPVVYIEDWDERTLLGCLASCEMNRPVPFTSQTFSLNDIEFVIIFDLGYGTGDVCEMRLGEGCNQIVVGDILYNVLNYRELREDLRDILWEGCTVPE